MALVDVILILVVGFFSMMGFFFGFVHTVGNLIGALLGIFLASRFSDSVAMQLGMENGGGLRIAIFIIVFFLISRIVGMAFWVVEKIAAMASVIPLAGTVNRLLGALLGGVEGIIVVGIILFFAMNHLSSDAVRLALEASSVAKYLVAMTSALQVLFPESLTM